MHAIIWMHMTPKQVEGEKVYPEKKSAILQENRVALPGSQRKSLRFMKNASPKMQLEWSYLGRDAP
jgi:hypothetical protein